MNITGHFQEVLIGINQKGFIPALIEVPDPPMVAVKRVGVTDIEMTHEFGEIGFGSFYE
jgi:hypothetical protein